MAEFENQEEVGDDNSSMAQHRSGGAVSGIDSSAAKENFPYMKCGNRSKQALEFTSRKDEAEGKTSGSPNNLWEQMP